MPALEARLETPVSAPSFHTRIAQVSSTLTRVLSYIFLRWALLPFLPFAVFTLFIVNLSSTLLGYTSDSEYELVDEIALRVEEEPIDKVTIINVDDGSATKLVEKVTEVEISESLAAREKPLNPWYSILTGAPSPSFFVTLLPLLINTLSVGFVADRLFREASYTADDLSFVRLGYVSDTEAKLFIREPDQSKMPVTFEIHVKDARPPFDNPLWQKAGGVRFTTNETDYSAVVTVPLHFPKQRTYEWRSSNNHSGEFTSPPRAGRVSDLPSGQFTFLASSCIVNRLPYNPLDHPLSIPGLRHLAKVLPTLRAQFMLFLGDFIYVDVPHQWGKNASHYRQKYRQVYASPEWQSVGQNLSWIHVLDDHEISNDWSSNQTGVYQTAIEPWHRYHAAANPPAARQAGTTYFSFTQGPASFFMLDTRTYRSSNALPVDDEEKTMLGRDQLEDLLEFLSRPEPRGVKWKVVASSVPFTKNWQFNKIDTWGGFQAERKVILEAMWNVASQGVGVVVLSGDRHEFAATKFPPPPGSRWPSSATVHEFSASPLSQFYSPFRTYKQTDQEDVMMKYINKGHSKFGAITIESHEEGEQSSLKYQLFVDGVETWNSVVLSPTPAIQEKTKPSFWDKFKLE